MSCGSPGLGLTLAESKRLLAGAQQEIVAVQARVHALRRSDCHDCGTASSDVRADERRTTGERGRVRRRGAERRCRVPGEQ
ncbi:MAG: hypothetical protein INR62_01410 [Rhodospirillales bacterium]|nr:hypothetical protein [Acetobacter sp.]